MDIISIYERLPLFLQHAACSAEGLRIRLTRFDHRFHKLLRVAEARSYWTQDRIEQFRNERLQRFVQHAAETVPFYREEFARQKINPAAIRDIKDLENLPIIDKSIVQSRILDFCSEGISRRTTTAAHTSGTTGGGIRFPVSFSSTQEQWATWWRYKRWRGLEMDTWCGFFGGRSIVPLHQTTPPYWRYNWPNRRILFSGYHLSQNTLAHYIEELRRSRVPWLDGYPSVLTLLANYLLERGERLGYRLQWLTIGAESLLPQQAACLQEAFGVAPFQHYGMAEGVANFSDCPQKKLHVDEDFSAVEFVPQSEGRFRVVGTNFTNPAFPLIRYDVGDLVELAETSCDCGRPGRIVRRVDGRAEDYIILKNGARLGRMDHIFKDMTAIREAQLYQNVPGEIVVRVVRNNQYTEANDHQLLAEFRQRVGDQADIQIEYVDRVSRSATGKLRFVVSEIPQGQLLQGETKSSCQRP